MADDRNILPEFPLLNFPKISKRFSLRMYLTFGTTLEVAWFSCPKCHYKDNLYRENSALSISYCRGGMPPEIEHVERDLLGQSQGVHRHQVNCAHIPFEHFHGVCKVCDFIFGIRVPEVKRG